jgi:hypothetical protein
MTTEDLKRLKISGWTVFSRMQKYGWVDDSGKEIPWTRWVNRKGREEIGQTSFRIIRHDRPAPSGSNAR